MNRGGFNSVYDVAGAGIETIWVPSDRSSPMAANGVFTQFGVSSTQERAPIVILEVHVLNEKAKRPLALRSLCGPSPHGRPLPALYCRILHTRCFGLAAAGRGFNKHRRRGAATPSEA